MQSAGKSATTRTKHSTNSLIKIPGKPKVKVTEVVQNQIDFLCEKIKTIEWSGILYYTIDKGDISNPEELEITLQHIYPMREGSAGYTSYSYEDERSKWDHFPILHPPALQWKKGNVHSHHNMDSYFSGTDNQDLVDRAEEVFMYLSLIVNNKNEMVARISFSLEGGVSLTNKHFPNFTFTKPLSNTGYVDCDIIPFEREEPNLGPMFMKAYAERTIARQEYGLFTSTSTSPTTSTPKWNRTNSWQLPESRITQTAPNQYKDKSLRKAMEDCKTSTVEELAILLILDEALGFGDGDLESRFELFNDELKSEGYSHVYIEEQIQYLTNVWDDIIKELDTSTEDVVGFLEGEGFDKHKSYTVIDIFLKSRNKKTNVK